MFLSLHSQVGGLERQVNSFPNWVWLRCRFEPHPLLPRGGFFWESPSPGFVCF